mmetsp:Transcript_37869/g.88616  ORF Transcript_37869/g.88616 Transcript_37869/m.88616 type:complete len:258 (-) Transcript_37869:313-1086(-)
MWHGVAPLRVTSHPLASFSLPQTRMRSFLLSTDQRPASIGAPVSHGFFCAVTIRSQRGMSHSVRRRNGMHGHRRCGAIGRSVARRPGCVPLYGGRFPRVEVRLSVRRVPEQAHAPEDSLDGALDWVWVERDAGPDEQEVGLDGKGEEGQKSGRHGEEHAVRGACYNLSPRGELRTQRIAGEEDGGRPGDDTDLQAHHQVADDAPLPHGARAEEREQKRPPPDVRWRNPQEAPPPQCRLGDADRREQWAEDGGDERRH